MKIIYMLVNIAVIVFVPLIMTGLINKTKAFWGGRKGASVFQVFYDIARLMKKGRVISTSTGWVFNFAPAISLAAVLCSAAIVPMTGGMQIIGFTGDFVLFMYLFGISRFMMIVMAMDTASSFEGMGASREASFSTFAEPGFFIFAGTFSLISGKISFSEIILNMPRIEGWTEIIILIATVLIFIIMIVETCRVPVDDPCTHLELTMIHEVMILDNSGPDLAIFTYQNSLKMLIWSSIISALIFPATGFLIIDISLLITVYMAISVITGTLESVTARFRMNMIPQFLFIMITLGLVILSVAVFFSRGGVQ